MQVVVVDLGNIVPANFRHWPSPPLHAVCTAIYRAPELLLGDTRFDARIDAWALGVIAVEMQTGRGMLLDGPIEKVPLRSEASRRRLREVDVDRECLVHLKRQRGPLPKGGPH